MVNKKLQVWLPLLFSLVLVLGMFFGYRLAAKNGSTASFFSSNKRNTLQEAMDLIRLKYVDSVKLDSLQGEAIQDMMEGLDPHSVYLPPVDLKAANEDLAGNFKGIGVEFNIFGDTVNVVNVFTGGPSEKAGVQIGDKIIRVNDSSLTRKGMTIEEMKKLIRGEEGTIAKLDLLRNGKLLTLPVTRGTIPVSAVDAAYISSPGVGYIRLSKFTDQSYEEFMAALEGLLKQGMKSLVFDLRGNGGGFMNEAVDMADEFLDGDKLVVYTEGINSRRAEYRCKRKGLFETGKLVILVDELSASASEVLAGALQDWCRATIVGRRTFGKGLVQQQYGLSDGSALRLTVARYYTPLGRSIQRSYGKGKKVYMDELWSRYSSGEMVSVDSFKSHNTGKVFYNNCKDTLYGGDGISPTYFVSIDTSQSMQRVLHLLNNADFNSVVYNYYLSHKTQVDQYKSLPDFVNGFNAGDMWSSFTSRYNDSFHLQTTAGRDRELVEQRLKALLARYRWRNAGYFQVLNSQDAVVKKALELINKP